MRLLYVSRSNGTHDRRFTEAWSAAGFDVESLSVDEVEGHGTPPGAAFAARLRATLTARPPALVQVGPTTWPGAVVAEHWHGPLIAASWGFDLMHDIDEEPAALAEARSVLRRADLVFVDNDGPDRRARELGADPAGIVSFPWGIDLAGFTGTSSGADRDERRIVSVRRHEPLYRVGDVIDAFAIAAKADDRLRLAIAGSGSLTESLKKRAMEVADRVEWLGDLAGPELADLLSTSGLYISSSPVDGSSVSLLEAMASRITVAVTDIEGNRQWVDESTGWMFPPGDAEGLAALMVRLTSGAEDLTERRRRARERVAAQADWAATVARFPGFAEAAIAASRTRGWLG